MWSPAALALMLMSASAPTDPARILADEALEAIGGQAALAKIHTVVLAGIRTRNALEQSTRPSGPWVQDIRDVVESRWLDTGALEDEERSRGLSTLGTNASSWIPRDVIVANDRAARRDDAGLTSAGGSPVQEAQETLSLGPERVLSTALAAPDLHKSAPEAINGFQHDVLAFTWNRARVKIYIEPYSKTPSAVEIVRPRPFNSYWAPWGDVDTRTDWDVWTLEPGGIRYPRLWSTVSNGQPEATFLIDRVELNPRRAPPVLTDQPAPRPIEQTAFPSDDRLVTLAPGIRQRPGPWNLLEVDQGNTTFIIEGPISNSYSARELASLRKRGRRVAGIVTSSDSWPHIGGLREYVAESVPLYCLDLNRPILERLFRAPHTSSPDSLELGRRAARWRVVQKRLAVGSGENRFELIPLRTATGERQMAVWFPARQLLYTSDLFQVTPDGSVFMPGTVEEMAQVVAREKLRVGVAVGMHYGPTSWDMILRWANLPKDLPAARGPDTSS